MSTQIDAGSPKEPEVMMNQGLTGSRTKISNLMINLRPDGSPYHTYS